LCSVFLFLVCFLVSRPRHRSSLGRFVRTNICAVAWDGTIFERINHKRDMYLLHVDTFGWCWWCWTFMKWN
jgi:hypothetical protein